MAIRIPDKNVVSVAVAAPSTTSVVSGNIAIPPGATVVVFAKHEDGSVGFEVRGPTSPKWNYSSLAVNGSTIGMAVGYCPRGYSGPVSAVFASSVSWRELAVCFFTGVDPVNPVISFATGTGNAAPHTVGPLDNVDSPADALYVWGFGAFYSVTSYTSPACGGATAVAESAPSDTLGTFAYNAKSEASRSGTATASGSGQYAAVMAMLRAAEVARPRTARRRTTPAGGTTFTQSVAGTLTSSGALLKQTGKVLAGTMASSGALLKMTGKLLSGTLTSAGALLKRTGKSFAGTLTSSGALLKQINKVLAGTLTSSGTLAMRTGKVLAGTLTSAGALVKQTRKSFAGTMTSSGTLLAIKTVLISLSGTLTSAGALTIRTGKSLAGTMASAGALLKKTSKSFAGTMTSSGTLTAIKTILKALSGTLTMSGALTRRTGKPLSGALAPVGDLVKQTRKALAGTLTSSGALLRARTAFKSLSGTLTSAGTLVKRAGKSVSGTLTSSGSITKRIGKSLTGLLTSIGDLLASVPGAVLPVTSRTMALLLSDSILLAVLSREGETAATLVDDGVVVAEILEVIDEP